MNVLRCKDIQLHLNPKRLKGERIIKNFTTVLDIPVLAPVTMAVFPFSCTGQARGSQRPLLCRRKTNASTAVDTNHSGWQNKSVQGMLFARSSGRREKPSGIRRQGRLLEFARAWSHQPPITRELPTVVRIPLMSSRGPFVLWSWKGWSCSRCRPPALKTSAAD